MNPPKIDVNTFGDISEALEGGLHVIVPEESLALYQDAWRDVLGDAATQFLKGTKLGTVETASGFKVYDCGQRLYSPARAIRYHIL